MNCLRESDEWICSVLCQGMCVGGWRVDSCLGIGGGGAVYGVTEINGNSCGALKIFAGDLENDVLHGADRIRQESDLIRRIQGYHGMPHWYKEGVWQGRPYFVREDLRPMEPDDMPSNDIELQVFLLHIIYSLKALHTEGWVHCDVKPANIARRQSGAGLYVLIDFGSAHKIGGHSQLPGECTINTVDGEYRSVGTLGYAPADGDFTPARDVYAVGHLIRDCFKEDVPFEWSLIINRCISNNPDYRYPDVMALMQDIEKLVKGELKGQVYRKLRKQKITEQRAIERSLADADEVSVSLEEVLQSDKERSVSGLKVFWIRLTRSPACHFVLRDRLVLDDNTVLIVSGKGILDADISGPATSVVVLRDYAALNNLTCEPPPENDLTYVMVGPGSYLNFPDVTSDDYKTFFPGRRRILRDLDATTSLRFGGPTSFAGVEEDALAAIDESVMPKSYKDVLTKFFKGEEFTVLPKNN